uniref:ABC transporter domain-containing protein n=1 Tax=Odontella aurita TaxID=265563 RepID=A0A7S4NHN6_9STRA
MTLPDAYNSVIGDWGVHLTGAQMQRIAIARALISDPKVLIFDEATKALDRENGESIQDIIDELALERNRTTIILPTRLSEIRHVDTIVAMDRGRCVETGHHDQLMNSSAGYYRTLVERENSSPAADDSFSRKRDAAADADDSNDEGRGGRGDRQRRDDCLLRFLNVRFSYPSRPNKTVLNGFNLSVRQGELLALVGPHRGGKMTALMLAGRLYDAIVGRVDYNGQDVRKLDVTWLREQICFLQLNAPLLNTTVARNIDPNGDYSREEIVKACGMANVHKEITSLRGGYDAEVRTGGSQLSACFRQRIALANAFLKRPNVILLDEASTNVDSELDDSVQDALERLLTTEGRTSVVVAHRNSTVRAADRIAYVVDGRVREVASHDDLMDHPNGPYRKLVESQRNRDFLDVESLRRSEVSLRIEDEDEEEEDAMALEEQVERGEFRAYDYQRARRIAFPDALHLILGACGSVIVGGVFPSCGYLFGRVSAVIYRSVPLCEKEGGPSPCGAAAVEAIANDTKNLSVQYGIYWIVIAAACLIGSAVTFWAFGTARERMNRRIRRSSFAALVRQEMGYFDRRSDARNTTYMLENDVGQIHVFSSEQIRVISKNLASLVAGLTIACVAMWPLALCSLAVFPLTRFATNLEVSAFLDEDGDENENQGFDSPGGIVLETLLHIRTVSSLGIERQRYRDYQRALKREDPNFVRIGLMAGVISALPLIIEQLTNALVYWWGGWLLYYYGHLYTFEDLVISLFSLFFALLSLSESVRGAQDNEMCQRSAGRVFYLLNRKSSIDPQPEEEEEV